MRIGWATTRFTRLHAVLLRLARGRLRRSWLFAAGQPVMGLTTIGRRSGTKRTTTVTAFCCGDRLAAAGVNLGLERNPGWSYNLEANPDAWITLRGRTIPVRARKAVGEEWEELWAQWIHVQPSAKTWAQLAGRQVPIFVLEPRDSRDAPKIAREAGRNRREGGSSWPELTHPAG
jgi:deazaflavin-dependent oxidoreductase (nitroreductase family)